MARVRAWIPMEVDLHGHRYAVDADGRVYVRVRTGTLAYDGRRRVKDQNRVAEVYAALKRERARQLGAARLPKWREVTVRRTWRERLFSWPWRPWVAARTERRLVP